MLSLCSTTVCKAPCAHARSRASRRTAVPVRAGLGEALNGVGAAFMKIFSPPQDDAPNGNWTGTTNAFTGKISHHGSGRPFKDGFTGTKASAEAIAADVAQAAEQGGNEAADYVSGAIQGVMGKNFSGKEDADQPSTGAEGWTGDLHGRKRDGFHAPRS